VRLIEGRWVNADSTTPERRYTAEDEHPGQPIRSPWAEELQPEKPTPDSAEDAAWDDPMIMSADRWPSLLASNPTPTPKD
jgi:hypothetical protein